jgi:hypothetical protein
MLARAFPNVISMFLLKAADLVVMPVLPSIFDETTTGEFLKKVETLEADQ